MGVPVKIDMSTVMQVLDEPEPEKDDFAFDGKAYDTGEQLLLRFSQEEIRTSIKYKYNDMTLTVTRKGGFENRMVFDPKKKTTCHYMMPHGEVVMDIVTESISVLEEDNVKTVRLDYSIMTGDDEIGRYKMVIKIKKYDI